MKRMARLFTDPWIRKIHWNQTIVPRKPASLVLALLMSWIAFAGSPSSPVKIVEHSRGKGEWVQQWLDFRRQGKLVARSPKFEGNWFAVPGEDRIVIWEQSFHFVADKVYFLDRMGNVLAVLRGYERSFECRYLKEHKTVVLFSWCMKAGKDLVSYDLFDLNGRQVASGRCHAAGEVEVLAASGLKIKLRLPEPVVY